MVRRKMFSLVLKLGALMTCGAAYGLLPKSKAVAWDGGFRTSGKAFAQNQLPPPQSTAAPTAAASYVCVPAGTCNNNPGNNTNVDPRIVTPINSLCPPGQVPCYSGQAGGNQCGIRYVSSVSNQDGVATAGAYPWQAFIENQSAYNASGVLIDRCHVLTAAHKVYSNIGTPNNIRITLGLWDVTNRTNTQYRFATDIRIAPDFNNRTLRNDLAIIRLNGSIALGSSTNIGNVCLPTPSQSFVGQNCTVSGWGQTAWGSKDAPTRYQKQVTVPIVNYATCVQSMSRSDILGANATMYLDRDGEICAGGQQLLDACTQDGGSPLVCRQPTGNYTVAGLVIWGKKCGLPGVYGVYVSLSNAAYRSWIDQMVRELPCPN